MRLLDLWLEYVDTQEILPIFEQSSTEYLIPQLKSQDWDQLPPVVMQIARGKDISCLHQLSSAQDLLTVLELLDECNEHQFLREIYNQLLNIENDQNGSTDRNPWTSCLLTFLPKAPYLTDLLLRSTVWASQKKSLKDDFHSIAPALLKSLILNAHLFLDLVRRQIALVIQELPLLSVQSLVDIIELVALTVSEPEAALNILLETIEPETSRLLSGRLTITTQLVKCLNGIALNHIDEARQGKKSAGEPLKLVRDGEKDGFELAKTQIRLDSPMIKMLKTGDHVRLTASSRPHNAPFDKPYSLDALVLQSQNGGTRLQCIHPQPSYLEDCTWDLYHCGSFVTAKTMFEALATFHTERRACCRLFEPLLELADPLTSTAGVAQALFSPVESLNDSQNRALEASMKSLLTFLWGPPGTGKTHTIVVILMQLLNTFPRERVLVAAPTHNAVDNILQKFITEKGIEKTGVRPLRVSTSVCTVFCL